MSAKSRIKLAFTSAAISNQSRSGRAAHHRGRWLALATILGSLCFDAAWAQAPGQMQAPPEIDRSADCNAACLRGFADQYLTALAAHDPLTLKTSPTLRAGENSHAIALGDNIWKTVVRLRPEKFYFTDPFAGQVLVMGVLEMRAAEPFIYAIRLKYERGLLSESETMVTSDKIAGQHFRPDLLPNLLKTLDGAATAPLNRAELLTAARAMWGAEAQAKALPVAEGCVRSENGEAPPMEGCRVGGQPQRNFRAPLVDVEKGVVVSYQLQDAVDPMPRDPPPNRAPEKTPVFYYRPLSFYLMQLAKVSGGKYQANAMFMNLQELGVSAVFRH